MICFDFALIGAIAMFMKWVHNGHIKNTSEFKNELRASYLVSQV